MPLTRLLGKMQARRRRGTKERGSFLQVMQNVMGRAKVKPPPFSAIISYFNPLSFPKWMVNVLLKASFVMRAREPG